jgi:hypothetical protein
MFLTAFVISSVRERLLSSVFDLRQGALLRWMSISSLAGEAVLINRIGVHWMYDRFRWRSLSWKHTENSVTNIRLCKGRMICCIWSKLPLTWKAATFVLTTIPGQYREGWDEMHLKTHPRASSFGFLFGSLICHNVAHLIWDSYTVWGLRRLRQTRCLIRAGWRNALFLCSLHW